MTVLAFKLTAKSATSEVCPTKYPLDGAGVYSVNKIFIARVGGGAAAPLPANPKSDAARMVDVTTLRR